MREGVEGQGHIFNGGQISRRGLKSGGWGGGDHGDNVVAMVIIVMVMIIAVAIVMAVSSAWYEGV